MSRAKIAPIASGHHQIWSPIPPNDLAADLTANCVGCTFCHRPQYPDYKEHQVILRLIGEKEFSPMVAMRMGLNFFYGWVKEDLEFSTDTYGFFFRDKISSDGNRWGIGASLGGTVKFQQFSLEPFIGGGYQQLKLNGDGVNTIYPGLYDLSKRRNEWSIGGGLSIKFNR